MTTPLGGNLPFDDNQAAKVPVYNEYLQNYLEATVIALNSKNLAGATTAQTLSVTEARKARHVFTNAGAAIDVKFPLAGTATRFVVKNVAGFTLTIKTDAGGSAGVPVVTGTTRELWINGNNVESAAPDVISSTGAIAPSIAARVFHSTTQSIANASPVALNFNSERYDNDVIHDNSTNNERLTCKTAGIYIITANVGFAANATGIRAIHIELNGTTLIGAPSQLAAGAGGATRLELTTQYQLTVGDYVRVVVFQDSGGSLNTEQNANISPEFMMVRVGA
jgi:hypothetical protein